MKGFLEDMLLRPMWGEGTSYNGLFGGAPPERATFCRLLRKGRVINVD